jgi:hypothetical protein
MFPSGLTRRTLQSQRGDHLLICANSLRVLLDLLREGMAMKRLPLQGLENHHFRRAPERVSLSKPEGSLC